MQPRDFLGVRKLLVPGDGEAPGELENAVLRALLAVVEGAACEGTSPHRNARRTQRDTQWYIPRVPGGT